jgi:hypothetical protein
MVCGNYKGESALIPVLTKENVSASFAKLISLVRPQDMLFNVLPRPSFAYAHACTELAEVTCAGGNIELSFRAQSRHNFPETFKTSFQVFDNISS